VPENTDKGQAHVEPAQNGVPELTGKTGGDGGTPAAPAQRGDATVSQSPDKDRFDEGFDKGRRASWRDFQEKFQQEHGVSYKDAVADWKKLRNADKKQDKQENAELVQLQRAAAQHEETVKKLQEQLTTLTTEVGMYRVTTPIREAIAKLGPRKPEYVPVLEREIASRVKLDDDGELTVLAADGKPNHKASLDDLAKEIADALPDLVTPPREGVGVTPGATTVTRSPKPRTGQAPSLEERVSALSKLF
jgi:hypothetical protein